MTVSVRANMNYFLNGLSYITGPTHTKGHTLDVIFSRSLDFKVTNAPEVVISDQFQRNMLICLNKQQWIYLKTTKCRHFLNVGTNDIFIDEFSYRTL